MARRDRLIRDAFRERFVITLTTGETFDGLLQDVDATSVLIVDAYVLEAPNNRTQVDGVLYLPRDRVAYMQRPGVKS